MKGVLVLAHGSKAKETEVAFEKVVSMAKDMLGEVIIEPAYLQFADVNLEKGLNNLIAKGVTEIDVVPYFLFEGLHIKEDIPAEIKEYLKDRSDIKINMKNVLGVDQRLAEILADRISS
ncbi:MAG: sirohydrochlorin chelatase [Anaerotignaceae bacterium]